MVGSQFLFYLCLCGGAVMVGLQFLFSLPLCDGVVVVGFVVGQFWFGLVIENLIFLWVCWIFVGFGLYFWFWVCCGVVGGGWSQSHIEEM